MHQMMTCQRDPQHSVIYVDVGGNYLKLEFILRDHIFLWVHAKAAKLVLRY